MTAAEDPYEQGPGFPRLNLTGLTDEHLRISTRIAQDADISIILNETADGDRSFVVQDRETIYVYRVPTATPVDWQKLDRIETGTDSIHPLDYVDARCELRGWLPASMAGDEEFAALVHD